MNIFLAFLLCSSLVFAEYLRGRCNSYKVVYDGGSIQNIKSGTEVKLFIEADRVRIVRGKEEIANIPAASITEISYGQGCSSSPHWHVAIGLAVSLCSELAHSWPSPNPKNTTSASPGPMETRKGWLRDAVRQERSIAENSPPSKASLERKPSTPTQ